MTLRLLIILMLASQVYASDCNNPSWCGGKPNFRAMLFAATSIYAPYPVCSENDIARNIATGSKGCDFNNDGVVDGRDYAIMVYLWKKNRRACGESMPGLSGKCSQK
jgi:hypothetical protein